MADVSIQLEIITHGPYLPPRGLTPKLNSGGGLIGSGASPMNCDQVSGAYVGPGSPVWSAPLRV